ncbi:MAG: hypothetical protein KAH23_09570, partial [Kiritimatiellae bacterium]|nr:hypothetical protein [Kiritimatiellia bacterium]
MVINLLLFLFFTGAIGLLAFDIMVVLLSYSIYWYEHANTNTDVNTKRFTRKNIQLLFTLIIPEIFFNYITLAILPLGFISNKKLTGNRGETPVLLLNGLFVNQSCWLWFKWQLHRQGFKNVATINLSSWHSEEAL